MLGVPGAVSLRAGAIGRADVTIYGFSRGKSMVPENKFIDPHVAPNYRGGRLLRSHGFTRP